MKERLERNEAGIDSLRSRMDADARFRRAMSGYDPRDVQAYVENVKRILAQQTKAAKQEQEDLLAQLDSARSEIQARNCAIKKLKELLYERDAQLSTASTRINTLLQSVKAHGAERDELERLREEVANSGSSERLRALEKETQQLRAAVAQASNLVNTWRAERERLIEESDRLREEVYYLRSVTVKPAENQDSSYDFEQSSAVFEQAARPTRSEVITAENRFVQQPAQPPLQQPIQQQPQQTYQQPVQPQPVQQPAQPDASQQQREFAQVADKLATLFAEAYQMISQYKSGVSTPQQEQPRQQPEQPRQQPPMQILRPDAVNAEIFYPRR
ncbi:MAG: hypothetical protein CVV04_11255 [Firmicutes bacterium HGW-Firmicutes-9]|nr:MAG: hypothetical protein CVV04_11255 [Firmicutes bacterium HGW-Firmicutes-9]